MIDPQTKPLLDRIEPSVPVAIGANDKLLATEKVVKDYH